MVNIKDFGNIDSLFFACSADERIRFQSSSGGFIKSFLLYLLESGLIDFAIVTRTGSSSSPLIPETIITDSKEDILSTRTNSVYAVNNPLHVLENIDPAKKYAFVGLPCQIRNLKALQRKGKYGNIVTIVSLFCHHTPDIQFTRNILEKLNIQEADVRQIEYRGNGWPGGFTAHLKNGQKKLISMRECWSNDLNNGPKMCEYCSEIGTEADICVGDPWNLELEKTDDKGLSLVICRNKTTRESIQSAAARNYISLKNCTKKELLRSQGYHIEEKLQRGRKQKGAGKTNILSKGKTLISFIRNPILGYRYFMSLVYPEFPGIANMLGMLRDPDRYSLSYLICVVPGIRQLLERTYSNRVLIWYWREERKTINLGDYITEVLLKELGYKSVKYHDANMLNILGKFSFCLLVVGSELHKDMLDYLKTPQLYIWGQGKGHGEYFDIKREPYENKLKIFAVRGPHTITQLKLNENTPTGDPALLMPIFFKIERDPSQYKITYIPHHSNRKGWDKKLKQLGAERYVDIMCSRRQFWSRVREIVSSKFVLTNSLHAAILSQAYGVPWALCLAENDELNFPDKWVDFFEYLGLAPQANSVLNYTEGIKWWENTGTKARIRDLKPLLDSFPLPIKSKKVLDLLKTCGGGTLEK
jgi:coenzyme F420-reducing hydrogenase beta subunit